ncbi:MAG: hypothetical protein QOD94_226 [Alphaproteobacteria bacterium]|nr:hypothetical protein [Alphaproteobacteria bacterium]
MLPANQRFVPGATSAHEVADTLSVLRPGEALTVIGLDVAQLGRLLSQRASTRCVLRLDLRDTETASLAIERILDDLAALAVLWPDWPEPDPSQVPTPWMPRWRLAALRSVSAGRVPRFRRLAPRTELIHLLSVLPDLILLSEVDPLRASRAAPVISACEWCRQHGATVGTLLAEMPASEPPWDRLLYGAIVVQRPPAEPALQRLILQPLESMFRGSLIESRMRAALHAAPDLSGLFEDEVVLTLGEGLTPRVDLVWATAKWSLNSMEPSMSAIPLTERTAIEITRFLSTAT